MSALLKIIWKDFHLFWTSAIIKFQKFLQPWWRISLKKCEIKVFWRHSSHQISKISKFVKLKHFGGILVTNFKMFFFLSRKCPIFVLFFVNILLYYHILPHSCWKACLYFILITYILVVNFVPQLVLTALLGRIWIQACLYFILITYILVVNFVPQLVLTTLLGRIWISWNCLIIFLTFCMTLKVHKR